MMDRGMMVNHRVSITGNHKPSFPVLSPLLIRISESLHFPGKFCEFMNFLNREVT